MGLFDNELRGPFGIKIPVSTPVSRMPQMSKSEQKVIEKKIRDKVDEHIHPQYELGQIIQKKRKLEDKLEDLLTASDNLGHHGEKKKEEEFRIAEHLFVRRGVYTHHAIYLGYGTVAHYSKDDHGKITIHKASLKEFADGKVIQVLPEEESPLTYSPEEAVSRAVSRIYEEKYNVIINNCEQYVRWCRCGRTE